MHTLSNHCNFVASPHTEKYTPGDDPSIDVEELVFGSANNPLPEIVNQPVAMEVSGNVTVWMAEKEDWEALKKIIRVSYSHLKNI